MNTRKAGLLLHPFFILSVVFLLLNDTYWKYEFHNWFTGKLSDFTGLFAFAVFLLSIFPGYKKTMTAGVALFFLWWKSPLSNSMISFLNHHSDFSFHRIVDISDWLALLMLPFAYHLKPISYPPSFARKVAAWCIGIISFFSFTATSMIRKLADDNKVLLDKTITTKKKESEIISSLKNHGINAVKDSAIYEKKWSNRYYLKSVDSNGRVSMTPADSLYKGVYTKIDYGSIYTIPQLYVDNDSIGNLQLIITGSYRDKTKISLHSFEYKGNGPDSLEYYSYPVWRKFKKPIKKKIKEIVR